MAHLFLRLPFIASIKVFTMGEGVNTLILGWYFDYFKKVALRLKQAYFKWTNQNISSLHSKKGEI